MSKFQLIKDRKKSVPTKVLESLANKEEYIEYLLYKLQINIYALFKKSLSQEERMYYLGRKESIEDLLVDLENHISNK